MVESEESLEFGTFLFLIKPIKQDGMKTAIQKIIE